MSTAIISTGASLPKKAVTNNDLSQLVNTNDQWITERTGIKTRHISTGETFLDIAKAASLQAIERSGINIQDIDLIIVSTITPDAIVPCAAGTLRKELGIKHAIAFDINASCTGFIFAASIADSMIKNLKIKNALIVSCDILSRITDWTDRSSCILFGDGAGAAILTQTDTPDVGILASHLTGDNDTSGALTCAIQYDANPFNPNPISVNKKIDMNGQAVFRYAVGALTNSITTVLQKAEKTLNDVDWFVPHQANQRIIDSAARKLKISSDRFFTNLDHCGNTSSASIPMALNDLMETGQVKKGDLIMLTGFGGGFSSGALLFKMER